MTDYTYEFGGMLYRNSREMHEACAEKWLCADGANKRDDMQEILATVSDEELAEEANEGWRLNCDEVADTLPGDDDGLGPIRCSMFAKKELTAAFATIRAHFDNHFPPED